MAQTQHAKRSPVGYQQLTVSSTSVSLTVPDLANRAVIQAQGDSVRWRDDGTDPTAAIGMLLYTNGTVPSDLLSYDGDLESYKAECLAAAREERRAAGRTGRPLPSERANRDEARRAAALSRAELAPLKKRIDDCEREIARITRDIARLDGRLGDTALYEREPGLAQTLMRDRGVLAKALEEAESLWLDASEAYEQARQSQNTNDAA